MVFCHSKLTRTESKKAKRGPSRELIVAESTKTGPRSYSIMEKRREKVGTLHRVHLKDDSRAVASSLNCASDNGA